MGLADKWNWQIRLNDHVIWVQPNKVNMNEMDYVDEMNEMDCGLKEIKMKHDQWSVDWRKWDETWTMKSIM